MSNIWRRTITCFSAAAEATSQSGPHREILYLCERGRLKEALQTLLHSHDPASLDSVTCSSVLQLCIDRNAKTEGRLIHDHLRNNGYVSDLRLDNKFVIFHSRTGDVESAREVFDGMARRTIVSWTAMVSGYSQNGCHEEAIETFILMRRSGVEPNQFTFGSALTACTAMGCMRRGSQVHGCAVKSGFAGNLFVQSALMDLYAKCGLIDGARCLFEDMEEKDVVSWNAMIGGFAVHRRGHEAFQLVCSMLRDGCMPDSFTFASLLRACGHAKGLVNVYQSHALIIHLGFINDNIVVGSLIDAYTKCRSMVCAKLLFDSLSSRDLMSCTALITGYSHEKAYSLEAVEIFLKINQEKFGIDDVIICSALSFCAKIAAICLGRQIHACAIKKQPNFDLAMNNALIDMYAKSGDIEDARGVFDEMQNRNVISWTSMINGYGKHGFGEDAVTLFERMECDGLKPNDVTFLSLLSACGHAGLTNKGWLCFNSMISKYGIRPRTEHYACVVDLLARGGKLEEAYDFVCKLNAKLNASLWGALLGACRMHNNMPLGKVTADHLFNIDPESSVNYVVLSNIYAAFGLWDDSTNTRLLMKKRCMKKDPGWSSLDITKKRDALLEMS